LRITAANPVDVTHNRSTAGTRRTYAHRVERLRADVQRLRRQVRIIWTVLLASGLTLVGILLAGVGLDLSLELCGLIAALSILVAVVTTPLLLKRQYEIQFAERMAEVNLRSIARIDRDWQNVPLPNAAPPGDRLTISEDLDLFGHASLCQLICRARTPWGLERIANWITVPADADSLCRRQEAIHELIPNLDFRQRLEATASFVESLGGQSERFAAWITDRRDERWLRPALWIARVLTAVAAAALVWFVVSEGSRMAAGLVFTGVVLVNILFSIALLGRVHTLFAMVNEGSDDATRYRQLIDGASDQTPVAGSLSELHGAVVRAKRGIRLLERLTWLSRFQNLKFALLFASSPPLFLLFLLYVFLQFVLLWDFHLAGALSAWRRHFGSAINDALEAVGQIEAISSLASVADEHPDWAFAKIRPDGARIIEAEGIGHPLLPPHACVRNDVTVGPPGTVLLVTGSNMSGKSTLLRALGTNVVLAQAGAPVCARSLLMPPVCIATVMRVTDSLEAGISLFMAELLGIRRVVDAADQLDSERDRVLLFLLDEILLGTNNAERQMAAAAVLSYLMTKNAIGAVSTHDLDLVTHPSIDAGCRAVYFRESFVTDGPEIRMVFDYLMRPGVAPTTNVPFLLKAVGLPFASAAPLKPPH